MISAGKKYAYLLLLTLAIISWWLVKITGTDENRVPVPAHSPDSFSKNYVKWEMNATGTLKSKLLADKMEHYSDDGTTYLERPLIIFDNGRMPPWLIKSETGILSADGKNLLLKGQVVIARDKSDQTRAIKITTTNLNVKPETSYAETTERAELLSPPNLTTGKGMKLVFAQPIHLELLANVQGKYEKK